MPTEIEYKSLPGAVALLQVSPIQRDCLQRQCPSEYTTGATHALGKT
jgi:hypothetical protein